MSGHLYEIMTMDDMTLVMKAQYTVTKYPLVNWNRNLICLPKRIVIKMARKKQPWRSIHTLNDLHREPLDLWPYHLMNTLGPALTDGPEISWSKQTTSSWGWKTTSTATLTQIQSTLSVLYQGCVWQNPPAKRKPRRSSTSLWRVECSLRSIQPIN